MSAQGAIPGTLLRRRLILHLTGENLTVFFFCLEQGFLAGERTRKLVKEKMNLRNRRQSKLLLLLRFQKEVLQNLFLFAAPTVQSFCRAQAP